MFRSRTTVADALRDELLHLDDEHVVYQLEGALFAVGPTGLFVLGGAEHDEAHDTALQLISLAAATRESLVDVLTWIPFVAPVVVTSHDIDGLPCISVTPALLHAVVGSGPRIVDPETVQRLHELDLTRMV